MYGVQYDRKRQTLPSYVKMRLIQTQTLSSRVVLIYHTEMQSLPSCMVWNTIEMQTQMEVCENMMRGMPRCSKQEWRQKRDTKKAKKK